MGYYTVTEPCVVGQLHYARVPAQPIEADDKVAAPLVASGALVPYPPKPAEAPQPEPSTAAKPRRTRN